MVMVVVRVIAVQNTHRLYNTQSRKRTPTYTWFRQLNSVVRR